jgi:hypothetical protein
MMLVALSIKLGHEAFYLNNLVEHRPHTAAALPLLILVESFTSLVLRCTNVMVPKVVQNRSELEA